MRTNVVVAVAVTLLCLAAPAAHGADLVAGRIDPAATPPGARAAGSTAEVKPVLAVPGLAEKVDFPSDQLIVPYYEVDKTSGIGQTTLFAIHNVDTAPHLVTISYIPEPGPIIEETVSLGPNATYTRNVRDVAGLPVDSDGFARGYIGVVADVQQGAHVLTGDFLQVDTGSNFATGDRMIEASDLCLFGEVRLLDFGSGTDLHLFINLPQGPPPGGSSSLSLFIYDQAGTYYSTISFHSSVHAIHLRTDDLNLPISFGQILMSFVNSGGGYAYATYSAEGRYSVGMNSACIN